MYVCNVNSGELYHHGVKGMKWGVRKKRVSVERASRDAKRLANLRAKEASAADKLRLQANMGLYTNTLGDRRVRKILDKSDKKLRAATNRAEKFIDKMKNKYADTPFSDIAVNNHKIKSGKTYCSVLMGRVGDSPYDGTARYLVTAGTWTK